MYRETTGRQSIWYSLRSMKRTAHELYEIRAKSRCLLFDRALLYVLCEEEVRSFALKYHTTDRVGTPTQIAVRRSSRVVTQLISLHQRGRAFAPNLCRLTQLQKRAREQDMRQRLALSTKSNTLIIDKGQQVLLVDLHPEHNPQWAREISEDIAVRKVQ
ncbi:MAG: hypothetical protein M1835_006724 [Candelina submexicana]|nr:MAG: hypothetical protein M1835_006724 [Candelina submexicana]